MAVYHNHFEIVKLLCENLVDLDVPSAGKIPSKSGLANESEMSFEEMESFKIYSKRHSYMEDSQKKPSKRNSHSSIRLHKVRSLILFWAVDLGNLQMLDYLWNFNKFQ